MLTSLGIWKSWRVSGTASSCIIIYGGSILAYWNIHCHVLEDNHIVPSPVMRVDAPIVLLASLSTCMLYSITSQKQGCQITAFLRPNLQQCSLFFFVLAFCFLCLLDYTNDDLASKMQWSGNPAQKQYDWYMILYVLFSLNSVVCTVCNEMLSNVLLLHPRKNLNIVDLNVNLEASY